jgi:hypothetical protein
LTYAGAAEPQPGVQGFMRGQQRRIIFVSFPGLIRRSHRLNRYFPFDYFCFFEQMPIMPIFLAEYRD